MRILFVVPHYFASELGSSARHGSSMVHRRTRRTQVILQTISRLHQTFGPRQGIIQIGDKRWVGVNQQHQHHLQIRLVTTEKDHLVDGLDLNRNWVDHQIVQSSPRHLGFAAHRILASELGRFDFYCYLEDDLWISDALFFDKIDWFVDQTDWKNVLLPNRFELANPDAPLARCYVDGDLKPHVTESFQDISQVPRLTGRVLGRTVRFERPSNPHSGCFFLTGAQMEYWSSQPHFGVARTEFVGPLESAASLGVTETFRVYKPAKENANFMEVQHGDPQFIDKIRHHPVNTDDAANH